MSTINPVSSSNAPVSAPLELMKGDQGPAVTQLQKQLTKAGFPLEADGDWGPKTDAAVRQFQQSHGLKADGIVGPKTQAALAKASGAAAPPPPSRPSPTFDLTKELSSADSQLSVAIGVAEGTRKPDGSMTAAYEGHIDPANHKPNKGTFSYQGEAYSPRNADSKQLETLRQFRPQYEAACRKAGLDPSNKMLAAAAFDLYNQAPKAATGKGGLLDQLPALAKKGVTAQSLAEARYQSFYDPATGKFDTNMSLKDLKADQKRRMTELVKVVGDTPPKAGPSVHVNIDFVSQFDSRVPGDYAGQRPAARCDNACEYMMRNTSDRNHRVVPGQSNASVMKSDSAALNYLESQLKAGKPVMLGVNRPHGTNPSSNLFGIDHYVVATGMGVDDKGRQYISFNDPKYTDAAQGSDQNPQNRLYLENGNFVQRGSSEPYDLRGIVRNG